MRALAVDPGSTTGLTIWERSPETVESPHGESFRSWMIAGQIEAVNCAWAEMCLMPISRGEIEERYVDVVVCESFTISSATVRKTRKGSNTAIEIIGALRWLCAASSIPFVLQAPVDASKFATDAKLKRLGWYTPGPDHARSSARHMLLYLTRNLHIDARRLLDSGA